MHFIDKIEIYYFRSIYRVIIKNITDFNILTGKNDVGKSNILKALNLFFNGGTDHLNAFDFNEDFNFKRSEAVKNR